MDIINSNGQYYKPDGSLDSTQYSAFHNGKKRPLGDPQESIMGVFNSCRITERQGWVIGIAANKVIDNKRYQCDIIFDGNNNSCSLWKK